MTDAPPPRSADSASPDFRAIFHGTSSVALIVFEAADYRILETNAAADRLYGYSAGELAGKSVLGLSVDPDRTRAALEHLADGGHDVPSRRIHRKKDGTHFPVSVAASVAESGGRRVFCKFVQDASAIDRTERELIRSDQRFRAVADYTYDWESWLDSDGRPVWVNPAVARFTGFSSEECLKMADYPLPLVAENHVPALRTLIQEALRGSTGNDVEFLARNRSGGTKWIAVSWQPLRDEHNAQIGVRMSMRDIDQRKAMERQVQRYASDMEKLAETRARRIIRLEQEKVHIEKLASLGELAASVAHEISNPLAGIKNALRLVLDMSPQPAEAAELLRLIDQEIARITALLRQMYQLYRPRTQPPRPLDPDVVLREILILHEGLLDEKNVSITFENRSGQVPPVLPEYEFRQIVQNLLLNAIEATEPGGAIEIACDRTDAGELRLTIADHGHGIPPDLVHQIFEPFFTTKTTPGKSGSGLGLAISRSLTQAMGGTIDVYETPGGGTTFALTFPELPTEPESPTPGSVRS